MNRDELQEEIALTFRYLPKRRGLAVLATGFGKSRVAFLVIKNLQPKKVLIVVESINNRDITYKNQFKEWGMEDYLKRTEFQTYQTVYKWKKEDKSLEDYLIIADECDFAFTKRYGKFFREYDDVPTLAMTGYMPKKKLELMQDTLPLFINIPASKLQKEKILNKTKFIFVQYELSDTPSIKITYRKNGEEKSFMQSENGMYKYFLKKEKKLKQEIEIAIMQGDFSKSVKLEKFLHEFLPREKASFLHNLDSSVPIVDMLKKEILKKKKNKVLIFSEYTKQADKLSVHTFHGKTGKKGEQNLQDFNDGKIRDLAVCSKLNRGANMEKLNYAILESFNRNITATMQRNGRLMRLSPKMQGIVYVLMPYYTEDNKAKPTRAVEWGRFIYKSLEGIEIEILNKCNYEIVKK